MRRTTSTPQFAQAAVGPFSLTIAEVALTRIGQAGEPNTDSVQHVDSMQFVAESQCSTVGGRPIAPRWRAFRMSAAQAISTTSSRWLRSARIKASSSSKSSKRENEPSVLLAEQLSPLAVPAMVHPPLPHGLVGPLVSVAAEVRHEVVHVVGQHHRMPVHVAQGDGVHQPLEAHLLLPVERHDHRGTRPTCLAMRSSVIARL
jgi:hypothetical protein